MNNIKAKQKILVAVGKRLRKGEVEETYEGTTILLVFVIVADTRTGFIIVDAKRDIRDLCPLFDILYEQ